MIALHVILTLSAAKRKNLLVGDADRANRFERGQFHRGSFAALRMDGRALRMKPS